MKDGGWGTYEDNDLRYGGAGSSSLERRGRWGDREGLKRGGIVRGRERRGGGREKSGGERVKLLGAKGEI